VCSPAAALAATIRDGEATLYRPVPAKVDFAQQELEILRFWEQIDAFRKRVARNVGGPRFSFIDGPITANNPMGVHHAWGRTYKDLYLRYRDMLGYEQRHQNGFDCQGLWVEVEVEKELGFNSKREIEAYGLDRFADRCRERVYRFAAEITRQSKRLGMWMDWENSYYTLSDTNIEHIWLFLQRCHEHGWLYQGARALPWCIRCGTSLSQHELVGTDSYREVTHRSVYLALPLRDRPGEAILVWTTTPWTLPANVALAVHPDLDYVKIRQGGRLYYLSAHATGFLRPGYEVVGTVKGRELAGLRYAGPFAELPAQAGIEHRVVLWEGVGEEEGTGVVHIAPGCGAEDFELAREQGLPVVEPIDEDGNYVAGFGELTGRNVREINPLVFASLAAKGYTYLEHDYTHRYPSCWRCGTELVFRLAREWFLAVDELRPRLRREAAKVRWVPESAGKRMDDWLVNMGDWCISRKRYWGLPLPFYPCSACGTLTVIGTQAELRERAVSGLDQLRELHRPWIDQVLVRCKGCEQPVRRIAEVGDAWLDAGIVPYSTLNYLTDRAYWRQWFPANFITEMREQIRLWFYSMLFMSVVLEDRTPYEAVLAYEKLLDERGQPMHRSLGNVIWFDEAAERMGADVMRWLYASQPIQANLLFGYGPAEEVRRKLLTLWNTYSFFVTYAALDRFDPLRTHVPTPQRALLDRWILGELHRLIGTVRAALDAYDPAAATRAVERFVDDLSNWYVRRSRRRFWRSGDDRDKQAAYLTLYEVLTTLLRLLAPFLPFLTEAMYQNLVRSVDPAAPESVHLCDYPRADGALIDERLAAQVARVRLLVSLGRAARNQARIKVRQPLPALRVAATNGTLDLPAELLADLRDELNVKRVELVPDLADVVQRVVRPNPRLIGPRLGEATQAVIAALRNGDFQVRADGTVEAAGHVLSPEEVQVTLSPRPGYAAAEAEGVTVALETALTPELLAEGRAREIVHRIQTLRKEADFQIADRIVTYYQGDAALEAAIAEQADYVAGETLSRELVRGASPADAYTWRGEVDGLPLTLGVRRLAEAETR
jgi:isoleucyl-tRNA synthetase